MEKSASKIIPAFAGKYNVLHADPPWVYRNKKTGGSATSGAENKYPTMNLETLKSIQVPVLVQKTAVLFLWQQCH